jgi:hypothetical protein
LPFNISVFDYNITARVRINNQTKIINNLFWKMKRVLFMMIIDSSIILSVSSCNKEALPIYTTPFTESITINKPGGGALDQK